MSRQARVGLLVTVGAILFFVALFAIANRSHLFSDTFFVNAEFNNVAGLQSGASVQYQGVSIGRVESVRLPDTPDSRINVQMAISENARRVLRKTTNAQIKTDGLVGNQIVVLDSPPGATEPIEDNDTIVGIDPFDLFEITDKALESVQNFESAATTFEQIILDVRNGEGSLGRMVYDSTLYNSIVSTADETRRVMNAMAANTEELVGLAADASDGLSNILVKVEEGDGTMSRLLNEDELYLKMLASADSVQSVTTDLQAVINNLELTTSWSTLAAFRMAELMEAAKHNWLFKRYFEERGYMEQAPFEVRERAIEESYRQISDKQRELLDWEERLKALENELNASGTMPADPPESIENEN